MKSFKNIDWCPFRYQEANVIARTAASEMFSRLQWMTVKPCVILDVGCGIGEDSVSMKQHYPDAKVISVDHSFSMIEKAYSLSPQVICGLGEQLPIQSQAVDIIFANLLLPWHVEYKKIFQEWRRVLCPEGIILFTTFGLDTLKEYREVNGSEHIPLLTDMHDIGDALIEAGFSDPVLDVNYYTTTYKSKEKLIDELFATGMLAAKPEALSNYMPNDNGVFLLTYEVIFAHAFAPTKQAQQMINGEVRIPLSQLKRSLY